MRGHQRLLETKPRVGAPTGRNVDVDVSQHGPWDKGNTPERAEHEKKGGCPNTAELPCQP